jgi:N-carbamoylputrescine amidase
MQLIQTSGPTPSLSPAIPEAQRRAPLRVGAVQHRWHRDPEEHRAALRQGVGLAASAGARLVCLQELTLSRYCADVRPAGSAAELAEDMETGPTRAFTAQLAAEFDVHVHASLYERADLGDGLGYNTAILVAPSGKLIARTRKLHIPKTAGYYEDHYFRPGPADGEPHPVVELGPARLGLPTCWDQWFPELARAYSLAGADLLIYPTAIGSEPDYPAFDTQPLWQSVIIGNAIANGLFMVAVNRIGNEGTNTFYGSSFICDPFGRVLVQAPRDEPAVLVADLDLDQRSDWLTLFPFLETRRPDAYGTLLNERAG